MWLLMAMAMGVVVGFALARMWRMEREKTYNQVLISVFGAFVGNRTFETIAAKFDNEATLNMWFQLGSGVVGAVILAIVVRAVWK